MHTRRSPPAREGSAGSVRIYRIRQTWPSRASGGGHAGGGAPPSVMPASAPRQRRRLCRRLRAVRIPRAHPLAERGDAARPAEALVDPPAHRVGCRRLPMGDEGLAGSRFEPTQPRQHLLVVRVRREPVQVHHLGADGTYAPWIFTSPAPSARSAPARSGGLEAGFRRIVLARSHVQRRLVSQVSSTQGSAIYLEDLLCGDARLHPPVHSGQPAGGHDHMNETRDSESGEPLWGSTLLQLYSRRCGMSRARCRMEERRDRVDRSSRCHTSVSPHPPA